MEGKPKILFILHLPPPVHGAAMVGEMIHGSEQFNRAFDCRYINLSTSASIGEIGKVSVGKLTAVMSLWKSVRKALADFRPDLVYVTASSTGLGFLKDSLLVSRIKKAGYRVVVHFHNKGVSRNPAFKPLYTRFFDGINVILLSGRLYPDIAAYIPRERVAFCPNGVTDCGRVDREDHSIPHILFLSNLIESKGIFVLLDACKILFGRHVRFFLDVAGGEGAAISEHRLRDEVNARGLSDLTRYHGAVTGVQKERMYHRADIFSLPTSNDCFPLVILEAMARSLPVVSTEEGAIPEMVSAGESGILVSPKDPTALADALEKLLKDKELRDRLGAFGRLRYEYSFTEEAFVRRFTEIMHKILEI